MFLEIRELEQKPIRFEQTLPPEAIRFDSDFEQLSPLLASGTAELRSATEEIRVQGRLQVTVGFICDRCAEPFSHQIDEEFDLIYRPDTNEFGGMEIEIKASESNVGFYQGPGLELNEILQEQVLLAVPLQRLCREECKGICPECGQDRNESNCECQTQRIDERWSALRNLS
jgi:uncharacterized protein